MGVSSLSGTLYLDSNIIIYLVEQEPRYYPILSALLTKANAGEVQLICSELAILECLVVPLRDHGYSGWGLSSSNRESLSKRHIRR